MIGLRISISKVSTISKLRNTCNIHFLNRLFSIGGITVPRRHLNIPEGNLIAK